MPAAPLLPVPVPAPSPAWPALPPFTPWQRSLFERLAHSDAALLAAMLSLAWVLLSLRTLSDREHRALAEVDLTLQRVIGRGSGGTVVFEALWDGRPVAVKRLVKAGAGLRSARAEVALLLSAGSGPNVVRYHTAMEDNDFIYLVLERCEFSLLDLTEALREEAQLLTGEPELVSGSSSLSSPPHSSASSSSRQLSSSPPSSSSHPSSSPSSFLGLPQPRPAPAPACVAASARAVAQAVVRDPDWQRQLRQLLRQVVTGVAHLHDAQHILHRDLKPGNVLLQRKGGQATERRSRRKGDGVRDEQGDQHGDGRSDGLPTSPLVKTRSLSVTSQTAAQSRGSGRARRLSDMEAKIADMGLGQFADGASSVSSFSSSASSARHTHIGTHGWRAPELLRGATGASVGTATEERTKSPASFSSSLASSNQPTTGAGVTRLRPGGSVAGYASDIFSLGCLLFYLFSRGQHPFGASTDREWNILRGLSSLDLTHVTWQPSPPPPHSTDTGNAAAAASSTSSSSFSSSSSSPYPLQPPAHAQPPPTPSYLEGWPLAEVTLFQHLISLTLHPDPSQRPSARSLLAHPFFWSPDRRSALLTELSNYLSATPPLPFAPMLQRALESRAREVLPPGWLSALPPTLLRALLQHRSYSEDKVVDCLRFLRNRESHARELSLEHVALLGAERDARNAFFQNRLPYLLLACYQAAALVVPTAPVPVPVPALVLVAASATNSSSVSAVASPTDTNSLAACNQAADTCSPSLSVGAQERELAAFFEGVSVPVIRQMQLAAMPSRPVLPPSRLWAPRSN